MTKRMKLPLEFFVRNDVVQVSRELLGKVLCSRLNGRVTKAIIIETEAYAGIDDKASHAYGDRRTQRTAPMYKRGSTAYVYLCYGIHHLFNVVVGEAGLPLAVLIRAGAPLEGVEVMRKRRKKPQTVASLLMGPGCLSQALGITTKLSGASLLGNRIWFEDQHIAVNQKEVITGPRVGIDYAEDDAQKPYRFRIASRSMGTFKNPQFFAEIRS